MSETNDQLSASLDIQRHTAAHVLAAAVQSLMKERGVEVKYAIGPVVENGFYYDFDFNGASLSLDDLPLLEKKMKEIVKKKVPMVKEEASIKEALKRVQGQPYKEELINELAEKGEKEVSFYSLGDVFTDLCRGPHVEHTGELGAFALTKVAGAYWRGDAKNAMLQRIYGVLFATKEELDAYQTMMKEAEARDHRKLGKELDLFIFSDLVGPGLPLYTPRGALIRRLIQDVSRAERVAIGYQEVHTPNMNKAELFKISGHYEKYKEDMFHVRSNYSDEEYFLKPMNCPQHTQLYAAHQHSYKQMPVRIADFANLYRDEKPGELSGLARLRAFSQDDAHCFCREDQIQEEFSRLLDAILRELALYHMECVIRLSTWDPGHKEKFLGDSAVWEKSQQVLKELLDAKGITYIDGAGEAAFYGPKMDFIAKDSLGRPWQVSTIQIDFNMPQRFHLTYVDEHGEEKTPVMIHSALIGSPERFLAILIEHYAGAFPLWLSPIQARVIPVAAAFVDYAQSVAKSLHDAGLRAEVDDSDDSLGKKIRNGEKEKVPYLLVVGEKEASAGGVAVRKRGEGDKGTRSIADVVADLVKEDKEKI